MKVTNQPRLPAQAVSDLFVNSKVQFLEDVHVWPERQKLDPYAWLKNFDATEMPFAVNLLNVFLYYSEPLVDALFRGAVKQLSANITAPAKTMDEAKALWRSFLNSVQITCVDGERPRPTDSGRLFLRKARQVLRIAEDQIATPEQVLRLLMRAPNVPILLVDDFVGSGNQMVATWTRQYGSMPGGVESLKAASTQGHAIYYVPLISTERGLRTLRKSCAGLNVHPAHVVDDRYSLAHPNSILWPESLKSGAIEFMRTASERAKIITEYEFGWTGFHGFALPLAFYHSVPDATLPLYFWDQHGWTPLIRRT